MFWKASAAMLLLACPAVLAIDNGLVSALSMPLQLKILTSHLPRASFLQCRTWGFPLYLWFLLFA